jgi:DNA-binding IclR family transcriptional regulator
LARFTPHTITGHQELLSELAQVRERGYATAQEELEEGLNVVAAPIHDHTGRVIAAASVAGPAYRVTPQRFPQLAAHLKEVAGQISDRLGYGQP